MSTRHGWLLFLLAAVAGAAEPVVKDAWTPIPVTRTGGVLGERLNLWRERRLWRAINDPFLLSGFESPPGTHLWQGEHVGKWLHAATLAYEATHDAKVRQSLEETTKRLLAAQQSNGYLGTYTAPNRFFAPPGPDTKKSWDIWTERYVLYGLLTYEQYHPDPAVVKACVRIGELLADTFGPGKRDFTEVGTRSGLSSATVLESVMMLYARTGDARFLALARQMHESMEANERLKVVSAMQSGVDVSTPGDGKAYQLMAVLLGYGEMYRYTGEKRFLEATTRAWETIRTQHIYETGGPWGYKSNPIKNVECFAEPRYYEPSNPVETCTTTTWIQLSLSLLRLTGEARYGDEAERALLNHLIGAQSPNGVDWSYYTSPNTPHREYNNELHCCGSSGPRALEMYARSLLGSAGGVLSVNTYLPVTADLSSRGVGPDSIVIEGNYPFEERVTMRLGVRSEKKFAVDFRLPVGAASMKVTIGGKSQKLQQTASGFLRLDRAWQPKDVAQIEFTFPLKANFHVDRDGKRWVAFTRGPLALAEESPGGQGEVVVDRESPDAARWLKPAGQGVRYRLEGTSATLVPYYQAGSGGASVRTLFPVKR